MVGIVYGQVRVIYVDRLRRENVASLIFLSSFPSRVQIFQACYDAPSGKDVAYFVYALSLSLYTGQVLVRLLEMSSRNSRANDSDNEAQGPELFHHIEAIFLSHWLLGRRIRYA